MVLAAFVYYVNNKMTSVVEDNSSRQLLTNLLILTSKRVENTGRATMGMRFKNNFKAWREV